jgi:hypothetical protein
MEFALSKTVGAVIIILFLREFANFIAMAKTEKKILHI